MNNPKCSSCSGGGGGGRVSGGGGGGYYLGSMIQTSSLAPGKTYLNIQTDEEKYENKYGFHSGKPKTVYVETKEEKAEKAKVEKMEKDGKTKLFEQRGFQQ